MIDEREVERQVALHDPLRRLGLHFSELRLTHPATNSPLTLISSCPTSFTDLIRRTHSSSRTTLMKSKSSGSDIKGVIEGGGDTLAVSIVENRDVSDRTRESHGQANEVGHLSVSDEDGQMDTLRSGSSQYAADSVSSGLDKVKVFTLSEFLGPGKVRGANKSDKRQDQQGPPPTSKTVYRRK